MFSFSIPLLPFYQEGLIVVCYKIHVAEAGIFAGNTWSTTFFSCQLLSLSTALN
jgi:hypothetical protein